MNDPRYPNQAQDFVHTFRTLRGLPCDIFLGAHGSYFDLKEKYPRLRSDGTNPFIDPKGYKAYVDESEQDFRSELARQRAAQQRNKPTSGSSAQH